MKLLFLLDDTYYIALQQFYNVPQKLKKGESIVFIASKIPSKATILESSCINKVN